RPEHLEMRKVVHGYFTPRSMEAWRPMVQAAMKDLRDAAEAKGRMDVMADLATPLPVLVIAQMMGVPLADRPYIRELAKKLLAGGLGTLDRLRTQTEGMQGMLEYLSPLVEERIHHPHADFVSLAASGQNRPISTPH